MGVHSKVSENQSTTSPLGNRSKQRFSSDISASPPNTSSRNPKRAPPARSPSHQCQPPARSSSHHTDQSQPNFGQTLPQPHIQNENWDIDQTVEHPQNLNVVSSVSTRTAIPDEEAPIIFIYFLHKNSQAPLRLPLRQINQSKI